MKKRVAGNWRFLLKLYFRISPRRVVMSCLSVLVGYVDMIFFSGFFIRYIVEGMENGFAFEQLGLFVGIVLIVFLGTTLLQTYYRNVTVPLTDIELYHSLNKMLYKKASSMDLDCYENSEFYETYLLALDSVENQLKETIDNLWKILWGGCAAVFIVCYMYTIDHWVCLFFAFPIIGNFAFGMKGNEYFYQMYERIMSYVRRKKYIMRVMHLVDYAKEIRMTNVFRLLQKKYARTVAQEVKSVEVDKKKQNVKNSGCWDSSQNMCRVS